MVVNEHLSWRRRWSQFVPRASLPDLAGPSVSDFADQHADRAELMGELGKFPERQRTVLVLRATTTASPTTRSPYCSTSRLEPSEAMRRGPWPHCGWR